jgi:hypothetical protein
VEGAKALQVAPAGRAELKVLADYVRDEGPLTYGGDVFLANATRHECECNEVARSARFLPARRCHGGPAGPRDGPQRTPRSSTGASAGDGVESVSGRAR